MGLSLIFRNDEMSEWIVGDQRALFLNSFTFGGGIE